MTTEASKLTINPQALGDELETYQFFLFVGWATLFCSPIAGAIVWAIVFANAERDIADLAGFLAGICTIAISCVYISFSAKNIERLKQKVAALDAKEHPVAISR